MNIQLQELLWWFNFFYALLFFIVAGVICSFVRDFQFIKKNLKLFALETIAWICVSGLPMLVYLYTRRNEPYTINKSKFMFYTLFISIQIGILNFILETGGTWSYFFKNYVQK
jgi:hypothetical protein